MGMVKDATGLTLQLELAEGKKPLRIQVLH